MRFLSFPVCFFPALFISNMSPEFQNQSETEPPSDLWLGRKGKPEVLLNLGNTEKFRDLRTVTEPKALLLGLRKRPGD